jgi:TRAP-type C4-dicarboxylate transport system permease small subunit
MVYFYKVLERINRVSSIAGQVLLAVMMLLIVANIVSRLFGLAIPGSYSIVVIMAVLVVSPAIMFTELDKSHMVMDFVVTRYPHRLRITVASIAFILCVVIWGLACWACLDFAWDKWVAFEVLDPLDIPVAPFRFIWGFALFLLSLISLASLLRPLVIKAERVEKESLIIKAEKE